jgi:hypothetical protein
MRLVAAIGSYSIDVIDLGVAEGVKKRMPFERQAASRAS